MQRMLGLTYVEVVVTRWLVACLFACWSDTCAYETSDAGALYTGGEGATALYNGRGIVFAHNTFRK